MEHEFRIAEMRWLEHHRDELCKEHAGKWVGIDPEGLIASAPNLMDLMEICKREGRDPLVIGIPKDNTPFYGGVSL